MTVPATMCRKARSIGAKRPRTRPWLSKCASVACSNGNSQVADGSESPLIDTRSLSQAKEPPARPMHPGDLLGDHGQRAIALAVIFEPVLANQLGVGVSAPLSHQHRAGLQPDPGVGA